MSPEQLGLFAQMLTLGGVVLGIGWGSLQHHWTEQTRRRAEERAEEDRLLLAANAANHTAAEAAAVEHRLEQRAADIRSSLEAAEARLADRQGKLMDRLDIAALALNKNTELTKEAVDHAQMAYHEANTVNEKIAALTQHAVTSNEQGNALMAGLGATGDDTLSRVKRVEDAVVQSDAQVAAEAAQTEKRLTRLEDNKQADQATAHQTRRLVETGEDTNRTAHAINDRLEAETKETPS